jgi:uncharacterized membrane protein YhhN
MKKLGWIIIFFLALAVHLLSIQLQDDLLRMATKPLLVLLLLTYFISHTAVVASPYKKWVVAALVFSWLGDVLLLFEANASVYFLLGLSSFLIAHIFYCLFFHSIRVKEGIRSNALLLLPVILYYASLLQLLSPHLGEMKLPVRIYGLVISFMLLLALHLYKVRMQAAGRLMLLGAVLFVVSDSVLAINKFYISFDGAGIIIMFTYGMAQWLITEGSIRWINATQKVQPPLVTQLQ